MKLDELQTRLWSAATNFRANSSIKLNEISEPILGLIFLKFAENVFNKTTIKINQDRSNSGRNIPIEPDDYKQFGVPYLDKQARYQYLLNLTDSENIGKKINEAMKLIEKDNPDLEGVLPMNYHQIEKGIKETNRTLSQLLKNFNQIPEDVEGDAFGDIYEYFLGQFALSEGQKGGEFFTPNSIVKLLINILDPKKGKFFDPACGSGGMFVETANYIEKNNPTDQNILKNIEIFGYEKIEKNLKTAKMNLAIHGLSGSLVQNNTYYEDPFESNGKFDFVYANPPFNVAGKAKKTGEVVIDPSELISDNRYDLGLPLAQAGHITNANYLWVQIFYSALSNKGRAGFVMADGAVDGSHAQEDIRKKLIEENSVEAVITISPNLFLNTTISAMLWILNKDKIEKNKKNILFIKAHDIYSDIENENKVKTVSPNQIGSIANTVIQYRNGNYLDIENNPGFSKIVNIKDIADENYSLNPGRYVDYKETPEKNEENKRTVEKFNNEFSALVELTKKLEDQIFDEKNSQ